MPTICRAPIAPTLEAYVKRHPAATDRRRGVPELRLLSRREFLEKLYTAGLRDARADRRLQSALRPVAPRVSTSVTPAMRFAGGFSLALWDWVDAQRRAPDQQVPPAHRDQAHRQ